MASTSLLTASEKSTIYPTSQTTGQNLRAFCRSLQLQIVLQATKLKNPHELKKTAIHRSRRAAISHALIHIVLLTAAIVIVVLNIKTVFIGVISTNVLTAVQFASKLVEILVQASIAAVVLACVRAQVLGSNKLPFGGLVAPFKVTDISSLWSLELWSCLTANNIDTTAGVFFVFLPIAIILAALVGPSSAVLMIPRPINYLMGTEMWFLDHPELVYPRDVKLSGGQLLLERQLNNTYNQIFVASPDTPITTEFLGSRNLQRTYLYDQNISVPYDFLFLDTVPTALSVRNAHSVIADTITIRTAQPYVYSSCWTYETMINVTDPSNQYVDFGPGKSYLRNALSFAKLMPGFAETLDDSILVLRGSDDGVLDLSDLTLVWSRSPHQISNNSLISVSGWGSPSHDQWRVYACTIDAYWATVTATKSPDLILRNEEPTSDHDTETFLSRLEDKAQITLSLEWVERVFTTAAGSLGNSTNHFQTWLLQSRLYTLVLSYIPPQSTEFDFFHASFSRTHSPSRDDLNTTQEQYSALINYINIKKLRQKFDSVFFYTNDSSWTDPATLAQVEQRWYATGYGYDSSTTTVKLSLSVIIFYLAVGSGYLVYTLVTGNVATSWDSVAEIIALALNSQRPKSLIHTSAGIDTLETLRQPINIRVNHDESLEIVFDDASQLKCYTNVEPNRKY